MEGEVNESIVLCSPSAPPPNPPPDFNTWSLQVPDWFWVVFVFTAIFALAGGAWVARSLFGIYATHRDAQGLGANRGRVTGLTLARLESQVSHMCEGI